MFPPMSEASAIEEEEPLRPGEAEEFAAYDAALAATVAKASEEAKLAPDIDAAAAIFERHGLGYDASQRMAGWVFEELAKEPAPQVGPALVSKA
jgi:hypothetical protein